MEYSPYHDDRQKLIEKVVSIIEAYGGELEYNYHPDVDEYFGIINFNNTENITKNSWMPLEEFVDYYLHKKGNN